jgi:serine/threonine-protein kinase
MSARVARMRSSLRAKHGLFHPSAAGYCIRVEDDGLESLVRAAGADPASVSVGATIRPGTVDGADQTVPANAAPTLRDLPRIAVDLRGSLGPGDASLAESSDLEVIRVLGEGGQGRVYLARQHSLEREVAVKTARDRAPEAARDAILTEGVIAGRLEHPAIIPVHALGVDESGRPVMVMKRVEGVGWDALLRDPTHPVWDDWGGDPDGRLPGHLQILGQICNAVHFAHSRGVVHRDIKPENVLIGRFGDVYLADWGVAAEIDESDSALCGTPGYMAPEMVGGGVLDSRTDVYLLGATLHEILTGEPRHQAATVVAALEAAKLSRPHRYGNDVPAELGELANSACHADRNARPNSAKQFREAIESYVMHRASVALGAQAMDRLERLEALAAVTEPSDADRREIERLLSEARFGLEQALAQWPSNQAARLALERLDRMVEARLDRSAELERLARERDPSIASRPRAFVFSLLCAVAVAMGAVVIAVDRWPSPAELLIFPTIWMAILVAVTIAWRRILFATAVNRQVVAAVLLGAGLVLLGRLLGLVVEVETWHHFARDAFVLAGVLAVVAIALLRWFAWLALIYAVAGTTCVLYPERSLIAFTLATSAAVIVGAAHAWRIGRGADRATRA